MTDKHKPQPALRHLASVICSLVPATHIKDDLLSSLRFGKKIHVSSSSSQSFFRFPWRFAAIPPSLPVAGIRFH
jgi:hypothetical protein